LIGSGVDIEGAAITERGRIAHPSQVEGPFGGKPLPVAIDPGPGSGSPGEPGPMSRSPRSSSTRPRIMRSLVIGVRLWTLSSAGLASSGLATLGSANLLPSPDRTAQELKPRRDKRITALTGSARLLGPPLTADTGRSTSELAASEGVVLADDEVDSPAP
jgi:hypothetical protein